MATTVDIKKGVALKFRNDVYLVLDFQHVKPGKGGAFVRTRLKSLTTGKIIDQTFNSGEEIDLVTVQRRKYQFLYSDEAGYHFMDQNTFEQVTLDADMVDGKEFLKEGQEVEIVFDAETDRALSCELPLHVVLKVTYAEPAVKGDTANNPMKKATLETGAEILVPMFVESGIYVKVDTRTGEYVERVKD
ncbi:MAG: elongation factor P [Chitinophagales bacterium]|nr:elongation factor P [Chitinophagales bacterium]MDW8428036.1 elongation factor P [Chitinophagales bacterium]